MELLGLWSIDNEVTPTKRKGRPVVDDTWSKVKSERGQTC